MEYVSKPSPWDFLLRLRWRIWNHWHGLGPSERSSLWLLLGVLLLILVCGGWVLLRPRQKSPSSGTQDC